MRARTLLSLALPLLAAAPPTVRDVLAMQTPDLSGRWVLDVGRSTFGDAPGPVAQMDEIDQVGNTLTIHRTRDIGEGPVPSRFVYQIGGDATRHEVGGQVTMTTTRWEGPVLVLHSVVDMPDAQAEVLDRMSLSADRWLLTIERIIRIAGMAEVAQTLVMTRH